MQASANEQRPDQDNQVESPVEEHKLEQGTPQYRRAIWALAMAGMASYALLYYVQPLLPVFSADFHIDAAASGLSLSMSTGLMALSLLAMGAIAAHFEQKTMMVWSLTITAALTLASAFLRDWGGFLAARALVGVALSGLPAVAMAYVGDRFAPRFVTHAMGFYVGAVGFGGMIGRVLVGAVADVAGWRGAVVCMAVLGLACAAVLRGFLPGGRGAPLATPAAVAVPPTLAPGTASLPRRPAKARAAAVLQPYLAHLRDRHLPRLFLLAFLMMGGFVTIYNYVAYRLLRPPFSLSQTEIGLVCSVYLFGIASSIYTGRVVARWGARRTFCSALAVMLAGILLTCAHTVAGILAGITVLTIGFFAAHSVASAWVSTIGGANRAQASALYLFSFYVGSSVMGWLGGVFWSAWQWTGVAGMTCLCVCIALGMASRLPRDPLREPDAREDSPTIRSES